MARLNGTSALTASDPPKVMASMRTTISAGASTDSWGLAYQGVSMIAASNARMT